MTRLRRFDHVGVTVDDLDAASTFFVALGLVADSEPITLEGAFLDTVCGIPDARTKIVMFRAPDGGSGIELSTFSRPAHTGGSQNVMANELGLRSLCFEVDDLNALVERLNAQGYGLVGGVGEYENSWRMAYVRGPEGIIVALAERIG